MKFTANLALMKYDRSAFERAFHKVMTDAIQEAARAYLKAVLLKIPVWSGASHGTFRDLADASGYALNIRPLVGSRVGLGANSSYGNVYFGPKRYVFLYRTSLPHLVYNEYNNGNANPGPGQFGLLTNPGPYNFQDAGTTAATRVLPVLPNPLDYIRTTRYRVG